MPKILSVPGHVTKNGISGVDFVRTIQPFQLLNGYENFEVDILTPEMDENTTIVTWMERAQKYDAFYLNYNNNPTGFAAMGCMARKFNKLMVMDLDDALWYIKPDNTAYNAYKQGSEGLRVIQSIINEVDYVTCTNNYLKNVIVHNSTKRHEKVKVFPNYIDLDLYQYRHKHRDTDRIVLYHYGSTSHFEDLANEEFAKGIDMVMQDYPQLTLLTIGAFLPEYKMRWGQRYNHGYGAQDIRDWAKIKFPEFMSQADIFVTPLKEDNYTRCKSSIKYIEVSSARMCGVWQDIRQYREVIRNGENGFLASTAEQWHDAIKKLISDISLRKKMGNAAYKDVVDNWTIQKHVKDYADWFNSILTKG